MEVVTELFAMSAESRDIEIGTAYGGHIVRYRWNEVIDGEECVMVRTSVFTDADTVGEFVKKLLKEYEKPDEGQEFNEKEIKKAKR